MNIRILLAHVSMCGIIALTGCSTKEAAKIDTTPVSAVTTGPAAESAGSLGKSGRLPADAVDAARNSAITSEADQTGAVGTETGLNPVFFDFDSYLLTADTRKIITGHAGWLEENRDNRIMLAGHTDERGSDSYNLALGEKRAIAVRRYLETLGVNHDRMETISYGEEKQSVTSHNEAAWAKNRRVEFVIIK